MPDLMATMAQVQGFRNLGIPSYSVSFPSRRLPLRDSRGADPSCLHPQLPIQLECSTALLRPRFDIFVQRSGDYMQLALYVSSSTKSFAPTSSIHFLIHLYVVS